MSFSNDPTLPVVPPSPWDGDHDLTVPPGEWNGWLDDHSKQFNDGVNTLKAALEAAFETLKTKPSDPAALASYQTKLSEYNMYRMLQSNSSKTLADMQKQNIRNIA